MCKLQWLMNNTFYLVTGALLECFKTGLFILLMFVFLRHMYFFTQANF